MRTGMFAAAAAAAAVVLPLIPTGAIAGGGGQNLLLVVNPDDENALRIAIAYQNARHIPDSNILFISPPAFKAAYPSAGSALSLTQQQFKDTYSTPIANAISARGLSAQIDYIGQIGGAHAIVTGLNFPESESV